MDKYSSQLPVHRAVHPIAHFTKTEEVPENQSSAEEALHLSLHDSQDSDSESLVQERMYQFELQRRIHENEQLMSKASVEKHDNSENEDNELWDSLEESSYSDGRSSVKLEHSSSALQKNTLSKQHSLNKYADLQYDPNWRNIQGPGCNFTQETNQHLQDSLEDSLEDSTDISDEDEAYLGDTDNFYIEKHNVGHKTDQTVQFSVREHTDRNQTKTLESGHTNGKQRKPLEEGDRQKTSSSPLYLNEGKIVNKSSLYSPSEPQFSFPLSSGLQHTFNTDLSEDCKTASKWTTVDLQHPDSYHVNVCNPEENLKVAEKQSTAYKAKLSCKRYNGNNIAGKQYLPTNSSKVSDMQSRRNTKPKEDIIERNKLTLGVSTHKNGSYVRLQKTKKVDTKNKTCLPVPAGHESVLGPSEAERTNMDPEERWHQRAERLKTKRHKTEQPNVEQNNKMIQGQPELLNTEQTSNGNAQNMDFKETKLHKSVKLDGKHINSRSPRGFDTERRDQASDSLHSDGAAILSSRSSPNLYNMHSLPSMNLNINVCTPLEFIPSISHDHSQATVNLISSQHPLQQTPSSLLNYSALNSPKAQLSMNYGNHQCNPEAFCHQHSSLLYGYPRCLPSQSPDKFIQNHHFQNHHHNEVHAEHIMHYKESKENAVNSPHHIERQLNSKQNPKSHISNGLPVMPLLHSVTVAHPSVTLPAQQMQYPFQEASWLRLSPSRRPLLPPIMQRVDSDSELYYGWEEEKQKTAVHRSNSESCLTQMQNQEHLKEKLVYKPYTLSDYKNLKQDIKLGGLGPDYHSGQETAEKLRRQKEYAALVRELNKKTIIPFSPQSKPPVSPESKRILARQKALEYAKRIPRPKPTVKAENSNKEASAERYQKTSGYIEETDLSQLSKLRMLQERHEKEKQAVAAFKALHVS